MTHLVVSALVNSIAVTLGAILILRFILLCFSDSWNATTREAAWWGVLAVAVMGPFVLACSAMPRVSTSIRAPVAAAFDRLVSHTTTSQPVLEVRSSRPNVALIENPRRYPVFPISIIGNRWPSWILRVWLVTTLLMFVRLLISYIELKRRTARAMEASGELATRAQECLNLAGGTRRVRMLITNEVRGPVSTGPFKPAILLPAFLPERLTGDELDQIVLHEMAHLCRRDDYKLWLQRCIEAFFVLHPLVQWITRRIDIEREIACDDFVVHITGSPRRYALCLTHLVEVCGGVRGAVLSSSVSGRRSHLERRVDMLLKDNRKNDTRVLRIRLAAVFTVLALVTMGMAEMPRLFVFVKPVSAAQVEIAESRPIPHPVVVVPAAPRPPIISRTRQAPTIVRVSVRVTDRLGRYVAGLEKMHFRINEDGVEQQIVEFLPAPWNRLDGISTIVLSNIRTGTDSDAVLKDVLESMTNPGNPSDELTMTRFENGMLLDAVRTAIDQARLAQNARKAILIVSDEPGDAPVYNEAEAKTVAASADLPIYSLSTISSRRVAAILDDFASNTGGRHLEITDAADRKQSSDIAAKIEVALRNYYVLTFQSTNSVRDGRYRSIELELLPPRGIQMLQSEYRPGYYASR